MQVPLSRSTAAKGDERELHRSTEPSSLFALLPLTPLRVNVILDDSSNPSPPRRTGATGPVRRVPVPPPLAPVQLNSGLSLSLSRTTAHSQTSTPDSTNSSLNTQLQRLLQRHAQSMSARAPLPDPPDPRRPQDPPARLPYPNSYGPSSTIRPQQPVKLNAHEALYGGGGNGGGGGRDALDAAAPAWIPYGKPPGRGSTFFIRGSGTQRLGGALGSSTRPRPPLPTPPLNAPSTSDAQASASFQQPQFTETTSYSPPTSLGAFPPGARPGYGATLRRFPNDDQATTRARAPFGDAVNSPPAGTATTKVPLGGSSSILLHAGFWDLLSATGSRFLSPVGAATGAPPFPANLGETDSFDRGYLGLKPGNGEMASRRVVTGVQGGLGGVQSAAATAASKQGALKKKKRVSVDMVGKPKEFQ